MNNNDNSLYFLLKFEYFWNLSYFYHQAVVPKMFSLHIKELF